MATEESPKLDPDDPILAIKTILKIIDALHKKFVPPSPKQDGQQRTTKSAGDGELRKTKSAAAGLSNPQDPEDLETSNVQMLTRANTVPAPSAEQDEIEGYTGKLKRNLWLLNEDMVKLQDLRCEVTYEVGKYITPLQKLLYKVEKGQAGAVLTMGMKTDLEDINKKIFNLMCQVPLVPYSEKERGGLDSEDGGEVDNNGKVIECLPSIHANEEYLKRLPVFKQVFDQFKELENDVLRICLLSFAVFPENQEVNRTMLMYWWIGEGLLDLADKNGWRRKEKEIAEEKRPENVVKGILRDFTKRKLIEPVENKRKVEPNSYKMSPFVHSSLVLISHEIGLFDMYHKAKKPSMNISALNKICLVDGSSSQVDAKASKMKDVNNIKTVFNVSERFPDFTFKWFTEVNPLKKKTLAPVTKTTYRNLEVFYLGRWERTAKRHIEVKNPELMKYLKHMTKLKLLSFQGISRIERLDDAVCKLQELIILDLRACYNLEKLPERIDLLRSLVYLDITDCYMIDRMPKMLMWLGNLEVLKGFVVSDATDEEKICLLADLSYLKHLRKLSVTINKGGDFTVNKLFNDIEGFQRLEKLKVAWGGINQHEKEITNVPSMFERTAFIMSEALGKPPPTPPPKGLPGKLKKLDLQCFPNAELPPWLKPDQLDVLEKLYIKGGTELTGFGGLLDGEPTKCNVKVLRLKFLPRLKVEWRDLKERYFPKLEFLEKYQCPQVSLCPCDGIGIWRKESQV